ncbi:hypothetical protein N7486_006898 [Penicillium sp. IBT 16267x]|nr:hypothetical protein N7486_010465 [Penicillium sp. IBT 16267x]KAJ6096152.1 hypothetical protein N7486_006898 [Penicillium sp. IBT 16267x]
MNTPAINAEMAWNNRTLTGADGHNPPLPWNDRPHPVTNNPPPQELVTALSSVETQTGEALYDTWRNAPDPDTLLPSILHLASLATAAATPRTTTPRATSNGGSNDVQRTVNKALLKDIRPIEKYGGKIQQFAAQKFLLDCDRYFEEIKLYLGEEPSEQAKVTFASGKLVDRAGQAWRAFKQKVAGNYAAPIETFQSFKSWIEHEFSEHLGKEKRWDYFDSLRQGARSVQAYAMELQQAAFDTGYVIPEEIMIQHLRKGANVALQQRWVEMNVTASTFVEAEKRLVEFERGRMLSEYLGRGATRSDPDAMDLSALPASHQPSGPTVPGRRNTRRCFGCGKTGHIRRDCRQGTPPKN